MFKLQNLLTNSLHCHIYGYHSVLEETQHHNLGLTTVNKNKTLQQLKIFVRRWSNRYYIIV